MVFSTKNVQDVTPKSTRDAAESMSPDDVLLKEHLGTDVLSRRLFFYDCYDIVDWELTSQKWRRSYLLLRPGDEGDSGGGGGDQDRTPPLLSTNCVESCEVFERVCHEEGTAKYLLERESSPSCQLYLIAIFDPAFYISRRVVRGRTVSSRIFRDDGDGDPSAEKYVLVGSREAFERGVPGAAKRLCEFVASEQIGVEMLNKRRSAGGAHLFEMDKRGAVRWLRSSGSVASLRRHLKDDPGGDEASLVTLLDLVERHDVTILSGEPGAGKSTAVERLHASLRPPWFSLALQLSQCAVERLVVLQEWRGSDITEEEIADFLVESSFREKKRQDRFKDAAKSLLARCFKKETHLRALLLLDSFDEVLDRRTREGIIKMVNFLKDGGKAKVLITTRPHMCKQLEESLGTFATHFEPLDFSTRVSYLINFWRHRAKNELEKDDRLMRDTAESFLQKVQQAVTVTTKDDFLDNSLHMRLIAETVAAKFSTNSYCVNFNDLLDLYENYAKNRIDIYIKKFCPDNDDSESTLCKLSELAVRTFPYLPNSTSYGLEGEEERLEKTGLLCMSDDTSESGWNFVHESIRDLFVSYWLRRWLTSEEVVDTLDLNCDLYKFELIEKFLVFDIFLNQKHKLVSAFLNCHLKMANIASSKIESCRIVFGNSYREEQHVEELGENVLHICVKENLQHLLEKFALRLLDTSSKAIKLLAHRTDELKTPLFYAATSDFDHAKDRSCLTALLNYIELLPDDRDIDEVLWSTLLNCNRTPQIVDALSSHLKNYPKILQKFSKIVTEIDAISQPFLDLCKSNNIKMVSQLLNSLRGDKIALKFLLLLTNEQRETGLHLTDDVQIARKLLTPSNVNLQDYHGMTPLSRALKNGKTDSMIKFLIKSGADNRADTKGNSALIHAAKNGRTGAMRLLFESGVISQRDVDARNMHGNTALMLAAKYDREEVVKCLIARNAQLNAKDRNGDTALHAAVKANAARTAKILINACPELMNIRNRQRETPFFYCIKTYKIGLAHSLMDKGADVNMGNGRMMPLQLLIESGKNKGFIKKLIEERRNEKGDVTKKGADMDYLTQDEKLYLKNL